MKKWETGWRLTSSALIVVCVSNFVNVVEATMTKKTTKNTNKGNEVKNWYYNEEAFGYSTIKKEN